MGEQLTPDRRVEQNEQREQLQSAAEGFAFRQAVLEGCFTIPGDGCVDYPRVFQALRDAHYEGWFVVEAEQDPAKANPFEYALKARDYIRQTAGL